MAEATKTKFDADMEKGELTVTRVFDAPREKTFKAFSTSEGLAAWWPPEGWTLPVSKLDFRVGGTWHYCMEGPNGEQSWGIGTFDEIDEPNRIVRSDSFSDESGTINENLPTMKLTFDFEPEGYTTRLVMRSVFASPQDLQKVIDMGMKEGLTQTLDKLETYLAK